MSPLRATPAQRFGMFLAFIEACLLGFVAALHLGWHPTIDGTIFEGPRLGAAALVELALGLILLLTLALPGRDGARASRVLGAQILVVVSIFAGQIAVERGISLATTRNELFYGATLVLALLSIVLLVMPGMRRPVTP